MNNLNSKKNSKKEILEKIKTFISNSDRIITAQIVAENLKINYKRASRLLRDLELNGYITKRTKGEYVSYTQTQLKPEIDSEVKNISRLIKEKSPFSCMLSGVFLI